MKLILSNRLEKSANGSRSAHFSNHFFAEFFLRVNLGYFRSAYMAAVAPHLPDIIGAVRKAGKTGSEHLDGAEQTQCFFVLLPVLGWHQPMDDALGG